MSRWLLVVLLAFIVGLVCAALTYLLPFQWFKGDPQEVRVVSAALVFIAVVVANIANLCLSYLTHKKSRGQAEARAQKDDNQTQSRT